MNAKFLKVYSAFSFLSGCFGYWLWVDLYRVGFGVIDKHWVFFCVFSQGPLLIGLWLLLRDYRAGIEASELDNEIYDACNSDRGLYPAQVAMGKFLYYFVVYLVGFFLVYAAKS